MRNSQADLARLRDQILARCDDLRSRGVNITEFGVDERANRVRIGVKDLTPESAELLVREFGDDKVYVVEGGLWTPQSP